LRTGIGLLGPAVGEGALNRIRGMLTVALTTELADAGPSLREESDAPTEAITDSEIVKRRQCELRAMAMIYRGRQSLDEIAPKQGRRIRCEKGDDATAVAGVRVFSVRQSVGCDLTGQRHSEQVIVSRNFGDVGRSCEWESSREDRLLVCLKGTPQPPVVLNTKKRVKLFLEPRR